MQNYILIKKSNLINNIFVIGEISSRVTSSDSAFNSVLKYKIADFERNNGKVKKRKFKTELKAIKQLIQDGYVVKITENDETYAINIEKSETDKTQPEMFLTNKKNGLICLIDEIEEWAQSVIEHTLNNNI